MHGTDLGIQDFVVDSEINSRWVFDNVRSTAYVQDMDTGEIGKLSQPGGPLYNIEHSNGGLITFPGGLPIQDASGNVIGAIGVSGSSVENDHTVAEAGVASLR